MQTFKYILSGSISGIFLFFIIFSLRNHTTAITAHDIGPGTSTTTISSSTPTSTPKQTTVFGYPVVHVVDGDTIDVLKDGVKTRIRLIGLDTPEVVDPRKVVQCFGQEASDEAKKILNGKSVRLETDPSQDLHDKYGRLLAYVFLEDGTNFDEFMIREGFGHEYTYRYPYKYQKEFKAAQVEAQNEKRGLWADGVCSSTGRM